MSSGHPPPGWYDDPTRSGAARWWDGSRWTQHVQTLTPPPPAPQPSPPSPEPGWQQPQPQPSHHQAATTQFLSPSSHEPSPRFLEPAPRSWWQRRLVLVPAGVVSLVVVAAAMGATADSDEAAVDAGGEELDDGIDRPVDEPSDDRTTTVLSSTATVSEPTTSTTSTTTSISAPSSTATSATTLVEVSTTVGAAASGSSTTGAPISTAAPTTAPTSTAAPTTAAPTTAAPATAAPPTTTAPPSTASGCDPNYSGACVPIASDVDCAGGSGNGPAYVRGPVTVVGRDIYGLDRDGDGIGCET